MARLPTQIVGKLDVAVGRCNELRIDERWVRGSGFDSTQSGGLNLSYGFNPRYPLTRSYAFAP